MLGPPPARRPGIFVSMKSGLEGRNNNKQRTTAATEKSRLNEVRPRRPEQSECLCQISIFGEMSQ